MIVVTLTILFRLSALRVSGLFFVKRIVGESEVSETCSCSTTPKVRWLQFKTEVRSCV